MQGIHELEYYTAGEKETELSTSIKVLERIRKTTEYKLHTSTYMKLKTFQLYVTYSFIVCLTL